MSRSTQKQRSFKFLLATLFAVVLLASTVFTFFASAEAGETQGWSFNDKEKYSSNSTFLS